jgi:hypothetical protein
MARKYDLGYGVGSAVGGGGDYGGTSSIGAGLIPSPAAPPVDWAAVAAAFAPAQAPAQAAGPASDSNADLKAFLDSQYATNAANLKAQLGFKTAQVEQDDANDETSYREALRRMEAQRPRDDQSAKESANKAGLFYSGTLGKNLGDIATNYQQRADDAGAARQSRANQRSAQKTALQSGYDVDIGDLAQSAAERKIANDTTAADAGYLVRDLGSGAQAPVAKAVVPVASAAKPAVVKKTKVKPLGSAVGRAVKSYL